MHCSSHWLETYCSMVINELPLPITIVQAKQCSQFCLSFCFFLSCRCSHMWIKKDKCAVFIYICLKSWRLAYSIYLCLRPWLPWKVVDVIGKVPCGMPQVASDSSQLEAIVKFPTDWRLPHGKIVWQALNKVQLTMCHFFFAILLEVDFISLVCRLRTLIPCLEHWHESYKKRSP